MAMELKLMLSNLKAVPLAGVLFFGHALTELILFAVLRHPKAKHKEVITAMILVVLASWFLTTSTFALWGL